MHKIFQDTRHLLVNNKIIQLYILLLLKFLVWNGIQVPKIALQPTWLSIRIAHNAREDLCARELFQHSIPPPQTVLLERNIFWNK